MGSEQANKGVQPPAQLFADEQWRPLLVQLDGLSERQRLWLSGYLAAGTISPQPQSAPPTARVVIAFGTETDNCRHLANQLASRCRGAGIVNEVVDMAQLRVRKLARLAFLVVITATHGDGDPPEPISGFYEDLMGDGAPNAERSAICRACPGRQQLRAVLRHRPAH